MELQREVRALITLFILVASGCLMYLMTLVSAEATQSLLAAGESDRSLEMILYNFVLYYVLAALFSLASFYLIDLFKVKNLTRPLQYTCMTAIMIQLYGACGYVGLWNDALFAQCQTMIINHYNALIALTAVQLTLFLNYWIDSHVPYIDRFRAVSWSLYNRKLLQFVPIRFK